MFGQYCYGDYDKEDFCSFGASDYTANLYVVGDSSIEAISDL